MGRLPIQKCPFGPGGNGDFGFGSARIATLAAVIIIQQFLIPFLKATILSV
jgi:hypothetical protein